MKVQKGRYDQLLLLAQLVLERKHVIKGIFGLGVNSKSSDDRRLREAVVWAAQGRSEIAAFQRAII